jgi:hypothetical protein
MVRSDSEPAATDAGPPATVVGVVPAPGHRRSMVRVSRLLEKLASAILSLGAQPETACRRRWHIKEKTTKLVARRGRESSLTIMARSAKIEHGVPRGGDAAGGGQRRDWARGTGCRVRRQLRQDLQSLGHPPYMLSRAGQMQARSAEAGAWCTTVDALLTTL